MAPDPRATRRRSPARHRPSPDPTATLECEVRRVQPYEAVKAYLCPGCNRDIPAGSGHVVAVPLDAPDLRRHWHRGCWEQRHRRMPPP